MANQTLNLNLIPDGVMPVVKVSQYDIGREIIFHLYQGADSYTPPSGSTVEVRGRKADGHIFIYNTTYASLSGSTITLTTSEQMTAWAGDCICQFRVKRGSTVLATLNFTMKVQLDPAASGDPSGSDLPAIITEATAQMEAAAASARSASTSATSAANSATSAGNSANRASSSASSAESAKNSARASATAAAASAAEAATWAGNPPYIGENGNWWVYDTTTQSFIDSGVDASISVRIADVAMLAPDSAPYVTNTGTDTDPVFHLFIPRGKGISSISKTSTSGLVDTYMITYSDGTTYEYAVTNGKTAYQGAVDGGYSKTEAEFNDELGNFADYAELAEESATAAAASKTAAEASEINAASARDSAISAKNSAEASAAAVDEVKEYVQGKADDIDAAVDRANDISQDLEEKRDEDYYRGSAATIAVGTVQTVASNVPATVTNSGTPSAAVFNFQIPKGERGDAGNVMEGATDTTDGISGAVPKPLAGQQDHVLCGNGEFRDMRTFFKDADNYISYNLL